MDSDLVVPVFAVKVRALRAASTYDSGFGKPCFKEHWSRKLNYLPAPELLASTKHNFLKVLMTDDSDIQGLGVGERDLISRKVSRRGGLM